jgi:iron complex outermembrane recepter protein
MIKNPNHSNTHVRQINRWGICPSFAKETLNKSFDKLRTNGNWLIPFVVGLSNHEWNQLVQSFPRLRRHHLSKSLSSLPIMAWLLLCLGGTASADDTAKHYHISPQQLSNALLQFAEDSKLELIVKADKLRGYNSGGLDGNMTSAQALSQLLQGSGMTYRFVDARTVTIDQPDANFRKTAATPDQPEAQTSGGDTTLPKVTVEADSGNPYDDPNWKTDPYNTNYNRPDAANASKTNTPDIKMPMSVQVVPKSVISDQNHARLKEVLENVSGVRPQATLGLGTRFIVRGFENPRIYRNGLLSNAADSFFSTDVDTANLENIEVLKGPAGMLFGRTEPGGLINLVTKRPLVTPYYALEQQFGSYDHYRTLWDAAGPIDSDKKLLYRVSGSFQDVGSFRDFVSSDRVMVNPSFTWQPTDRTELKLDIEGFDQEYQGNLGVTANCFKQTEFNRLHCTRPANVPINRSFGDPNDPRDEISKVHVGTEITHKFNDDWFVRNKFLASFLHGKDTTLIPLSLGHLASDPLNIDRFVQRNVFRQSSDQETYATNLDLLGKFDLGSSQHDVLVGFDYLNSHTNYTLSGQFFFPDSGLDIDMFNPTYGVDPQLIEQTAQNVPFPNFNVFKSEWYGLYFQDDITLFDKLHILGGGRYDWAARGRGNAFNFDEAGDNTKMIRNEKFSPRVGILYEVLPSLSVYGNWTNTFSAYPAVNGSGEPVQPQTSEQFEAGLKGALPNGRLSGTLAYFHLTKNNILTPDRSTPDPTDSAPIGEALSQGLELDIAGEIVDGLNLIGSYAYTDTEILVDNTVFADGTTNVGNRLTNVPEHAGSLWLKYDFKHYAPVDGLQLGIGAYAAGQREGNYENTLKLPGYVRLDALVGYKWNVGKSSVTTQLNIRNLLDKTYYESTDPNNNADPNLSIYPGAPLSFFGSVRVEF